MNNSGRNPVSPEPDPGPIARPHPKNSNPPDRPLQERTSGQVLCRVCWDKWRPPPIGDRDTAYNECH
ncbi:MAG: hypothetical protein EBE86_019625 [Hormoscilla sp. GUM202]|nr:hypothetical protein [Hormoscilla sp. GUM202]